MDSNKLLAWYSQNKRDLPWRNTKNPYYIWLSEIILQQTRVAQGISYYQKFIQKYPKLTDLAQANEQEILKLWQGLGYYSRARNLHFAAKQIIKEFNGIFPDSYKDLLKLKGVGEYTAAAIASICYNEPIAVLDGNVFRVLSRIFGVDVPVNTSEGKKIFKELAQKNIHKQFPAEYNQAIMEFGALYCKPVNPNCKSCIFKQTCIACQIGKTNEFPVKTKKVKIKKRYFNYLIISNKNKIVLQKRKQKDIWKNLYEFPLIETSNDESIDKIQIDKLLHKLGLKQKSNPVLVCSKIHKLTHQHLYINFWKIIPEKQIINGIFIDKIDRYPMPIIIAKVFDKQINIIKKIESKY
jgi:A/G-specific adenine glycosylase